MNAVVVATKTIAALAAEAVATKTTAALVAEAVATKTTAALAAGAVATKTTAALVAEVVAIKTTAALVAEAVATKMTAALAAGAVATKTTAALAAGAVVTKTTAVLAAGAVATKTTAARAVEAVATKTIAACAAGADTRMRDGRAVRVVMTSAGFAAAGTREEGQGVTRTGPSVNGQAVESVVRVRWAAVQRVVAVTVSVARITPAEVNGRECGRGQRTLPAPVPADQLRFGRAYTVRLHR